VSQPQATPRPRHRWYAAAYDKLIEPSGKKLMTPLRRKLVSQAHGHVLELGAGTGSNLPFYDWSRVESLDVTEPDPFMLQRLQPKLQALPADARERVHTHDAAAEHLPFEDASFDCAVVTLVLCTVADVDASLAELRRVLKPGAEVVLLEHVRAVGAWGKVQRLIQPVYGWTAGGCHLRRDTEQSLRDAGFELEVTQRTTLGAPIFPSFVATARRAAS
jgi:ubiquinone/menaquinone biosynthesis C-methylase UbiE